MQGRAGGSVKEMMQGGAPRAGQPSMQASPERNVIGGGRAASRAPAPRTSPLLLVLLFVGFIGLGLPDGQLGVAWPSMRQTFGLPLDALGPLLITTIAGSLVASLASGWLVERIGVGWLLALSAFVTAIALFGRALAPTWDLVVLLGILFGLGAGAIDAGLNTYVALTHSPRLLNWLHASFGVGAAAGPAIMLAVLDAGQPWQLGYSIVAVGQVALGLCFVLTIKQWRLASAEPEPVGSAPRTAHVHVTPSAPGGAWLLIGLSVLAFFVYAGVEATAGQWAYSLFVEARGMSPWSAGLATSAYWGMLALGRVLAGLVANQVTPATMVRVSVAGMLAGALLVWLDAGAAVSFVGLTVLGVAAAPVFPTLIAVTPGRLGEARAATAIGFQVGSAALGIAALPSLAGVLAEHLGLEAVASFLVISALALVLLHEAILRSASGLAIRPDRDLAPAIRSAGPGGAVH